MGTLPKCMTKGQVLEYRRLQDSVKSWIDAGKKPPEYLLNDKFNFINAILVFEYNSKREVI